MIDSIPQPWTVRGRSFSRDELLQIRAIVDASPHDPRSLLSRRICEAFDWRQPNGRLKDRSCREVLLRLHDLAFLKLPPRRVEARRRRPIPITARTDPRVPRPFSPRDLDGAAFFVVTRSRSRALVLSAAKNRGNLAAKQPVARRLFRHLPGNVSSERGRDRPPARCEQP
jgi:hypothetical protein